MTRTPNLYRHSSPERQNLNLDVRAAGSVATTLPAGASTVGTGSAAFG